MCTLWNSVCGQWGYSKVSGCPSHPWREKINVYVVFSVMCFTYSLLLKWDTELKEPATKPRAPLCKWEHRQQMMWSCRPHYISLCHFLGPPAVTLAPLSVTFSYRITRCSPLYLCVLIPCASRDRWRGGVGCSGSGRISLFHREQYPFWCISEPFVSLTRTNGLVADGMRMKWREEAWVNGAEMRGYKTLLSGYSRLLHYLLVVYGRCCFQLYCWLDCELLCLSSQLCVIISSASLLARALSALQPLSPVLFTYIEEHWL